MQYFITFSASNRETLMKRIITTTLLITFTITASFAAMQERQTKKASDSSRTSINLRPQRLTIKPAKLKLKVEKPFKELLIDWLLKFE